MTSYVKHENSRYLLLFSRDWKQLFDFYIFALVEVWIFFIHLV